MIELIDREQVLQTFDQYCERCDQPYRSDRYWECKHCRFRDARSIIRSCPAGVSMSQWIPCSERLPEYEERVLLSCENGDVFVGYLDRHTYFKAKQGGFERKYINKWWDYADEYDFDFDEITAWQPLPESYKGVDG